MTKCWFASLKPQVTLVTLHRLYIAQIKRLVQGFAYYIFLYSHYIEPVFGKSEQTGSVTESHEKKKRDSKEYPVTHIHVAQSNGS